MQVLSAVASQQNEHDKYLLSVYSVEKLLMIDSGPVQNLWSISSNKFDKLCISLAFIIRIPHSWFSVSSRVKMKFG